MQHLNGSADKSRLASRKMSFIVLSGITASSLEPLQSFPLFSQGTSGPSCSRRVLSISSDLSFLQRGSASAWARAPLRGLSGTVGNYGACSSSGGAPGTQTKTVIRFQPRRPKSMLASGQIPGLPKAHGGVGPICYWPYRLRLHSNYDLHAG